MRMMEARRECAALRQRIDATHTGIIEDMEGGDWRITFSNAGKRKRLMYMTVQIISHQDTGEGLLLCTIKNFDDVIKATLGMQDGQIYKWNPTISIHLVIQQYDNKGNHKNATIVTRNSPADLDCFVIPGVSIEFTLFPSEARNVMPHFMADLSAAALAA